MGIYHIFELLLTTLSFFSPAVSLQLNYFNSKGHFQKNSETQCTTNHRKYNHLALYATNDKFDLSKPAFDLFSVKFIRNDALLQYSSLNQSEPLRINIFFILALCLFAYPGLSDAVLSEKADLSSTVLSCLGGFCSSALFLRECRSRLKQLLRIEKELNAENLNVRLSTINKFDERLYGNQPVIRLKDLQGKKRIIAIYGASESLKKMTVQLRVFRRRLSQAETIIVILPNDVSDPYNLSHLDINEYEIRREQWLAKIENFEMWKKYFDSLVEEGPSSDLVWFGLNFNGRSFASGITMEPNILQLLGQNLRPLEWIIEKEEDSSLTANTEEVLLNLKSIKKCQEDFYIGLTKGDEDIVNHLCDMNIAEEVSKIVEAGGHIDDWHSCLVDGARPEGMRTSDSDFLIVSPTLAYSTCIELPVISGDFVDSASRTLLAVQRWNRKSQQDDWKLELHQTIPWTADKRAGGLLMCDSRGCVALTRETEKRTFGGLIG